MPEPAGTGAEATIGEFLEHGTDLDDRGNLKMQVDFRSVYAAMLEKWLKVPSEAVLAKKYPLVECIA